MSQQILSEPLCTARLADMFAHAQQGRLGNFYAPDIQGLIDTHVSLRAINADLLKALEELLPVAKETCKLWPNDDCFLVPTANARMAIIRAKAG